MSDAFAVGNTGSFKTQGEVKRAMWHNVRALNAISNTCLAIFFLAVGAGIVSWLIQKPVYALQTVKVQSANGETLRHVNALTVKSIALPNIKGNFFTVDLNEVRTAFEAVPWVRQASVRREWPDRLIVSLEEYQPLGIWGTEGQLLSTKGDLFTVNMAEAEEDYDLLKFSGPAGSEKEVLARYEDFYRRFSEVHLVPKEIRLSERYAWTVKLDNGMRIEFGREKDQNTMNNLMNRLMEAYPQLAEKTGNGIENIDMRYPNGLALKAKGKLLASSVKQNSVAL